MYRSGEEGGQSRTAEAANQTYSVLVPDTVLYHILIRYWTGDEGGQSRTAEAANLAFSYLVLTPVLFIDTV